MHTKPSPTNFLPPLGPASYRIRSSAGTHEIDPVIVELEEVFNGNACMHDEMQQNYATTALPSMVPHCGAWISCCALCTQCEFKKMPRYLRLRECAWDYM